MTRELAHDVVEAAHDAGGEARVYGPMKSGAYGASIGKLPDVPRFIRALRARGVAGTVTYNAGTGWAVAER